MKRLITAALNEKVALISKSQYHLMDGTVMSCCEAVKNLLQTYATDDFIDDTVVDGMQFPPPSNILRTEYAKLFVTKR